MRGDLEYQAYSFENTKLVRLSFTKFLAVRQVWRTKQKRPAFREWKAGRLSYYGKVLTGEIAPAGLTVIDRVTGRHRRAIHLERSPGAIARLPRVAVGVRGIGAKQLVAGELLLGAAREVDGDVRRLDPHLELHLATLLRARDRAGVCATTPREQRTRRTGSGCCGAEVGPVGVDPLDGPGQDHVVDLFRGARGRERETDDQVFRVARDRCATRAGRDRCPTRARIRTAGAADAPAGSVLRAGLAAGGAVGADAALRRAGRADRGSRTSGSGRAAGAGRPTRGGSAAGARRGAVAGAETAAVRIAHVGTGVAVGAGADLGLARGARRVGRLRAGTIGHAGRETERADETKQDLRIGHDTLLVVVPRCGGLGSRHWRGSGCILL